MRNESEDTTKCIKCNKTFKFVNHGDVYPGGKEREPVDCPYCKYENFTIITSGTIRTYKIEDQGDMEENYYHGQQVIKQIQALMKQVAEHANYRPDKEHIKLITRISADLETLYKKLEF